MKLSRREFVKTISFSALVVALSPRVALAAPNAVKNIRTGIQPGGKTRLVIETRSRPSYTLSYGEKQLIVNLSNTNGDSAISPSLANSTLIKRIMQIQDGSTLKINATLGSAIDAIEKNQIMILEPNGDNDYRLVLDFTAGSGKGINNVRSETATKTTATASTTSTQPTKTTNTKQHIIVVDAGHGGKDPGCIGKGGTQEKTIVLSVARKLKNKLDLAGYKTFLTRSSDVYLKLAERAEIAEKKHADLFISLHANANPSRDMKGFSIYTLSEKASDEEAQKLAESENAADKIDVNGFEKFSKEIRVALSSLQQHAVAELSEEYANGAAKSFNRASIEQQKGPAVRHAPFAVLRSTVPGALIELGHLSNKNEEKLLKSDAHQNKLVDAIVKSVNDYDFDV
ncbi:MAG: N-acetylmuramoyl-L-alanine amidase [Alphaproteobacteria bacterium]|nr:N-acetylmuramoyl-L-alanine amidase [Alphaproteobacteria bacterium]